ncbi:MAG: DNA-processing protein DprA [Syntrophobacteraceae bacterium]
MNSIGALETLIVDLLNPLPSPPIFKKRVLSGGFQKLWAIGDLHILSNPLVAFFCSSKCPGQVILRVYDLARSLRDAGITVISGFHSSMERECLEFLIRGDQPIVICPARGIDGMRLPSKWQKAISGKRLLLLSPFDPNHRRSTNALPETRNRFAADLADSVLVAHAAEGGKLEKLCLVLMVQGKAVNTLDVGENVSLIKKGAGVHPDSFGKVHSSGK